MNLIDAIANRTSTRAYLSNPVEREKLEAVVAAGNIAPIFGKLQISVISNPSLMADIDSTAVAVMQHCGVEFLENMAAAPGYHPFYGAPALILLSAAGGNDLNGFNMANASCAAENIMTQATALGLGSCFIMGAMMAFSDESLRKKLGLKAENTALVGVTLGYPTQPLSPNKRTGENDITYFD